MINKQVDTSVDFLFKSEIKYSTTGTTMFIFAFFGILGMFYKNTPPPLVSFSLVWIWRAFFFFYDEVLKKCNTLVISVS